MPASVLRPGSLAYDMMYGPAAQGFLDWATQAARTRATAWACWWNRRPRPSWSGAAYAPGGQVLAELRALMAAPTPSR